MRCERYSGKKQRCSAEAVAFRMGDWVCHDHRPPGNPNCTHALRGFEGACALCGAEKPIDTRLESE